MVVQYLLITHGNLGKSLIEVVESIIKDKCDIDFLSIDHQASLPSIDNDILTKVKSCLQKGELLILNDLYGATPCNECCKALDIPGVEMVSGINLPMILKISTHPNFNTALEAAQFFKNYGQQHIRLAREIKNSGCK